MKKFFTLTMLLVLAMTVNAQETYRKSWDFTKGLSDETIANLNADATNWAENGKDGDGNVNNWKNNACMSRPGATEGFMASQELTTMFSVKCLLRRQTTRGT